MEDSSKSGLVGAASWTSGGGGCGVVGGGITGPAQIASGPLRVPASRRMMINRRWLVLAGTDLRSNRDLSKIEPDYLFPFKSLLLPPPLPPTLLLLLSWSLLLFPLFYLPFFTSVYSWLVFHSFLTSPLLLSHPSVNILSLLSVESFILF